jgi:tRNA(fMet)-specific endonuclease VapC
MKFGATFAIALLSPPCRSGKPCATSSTPTSSPNQPKPQPNPKVLELLTQFTQEIAISAVTWHELWFGIEQLPPSRKRQTLEQYLNELSASNLPILSYSPDAARWFAAERSRLIGIGLTPAYADGQIAAIAHVNHLTLVTRNRSDFQHFNGVILENWFDP